MVPVARWRRDRDSVVTRKAATEPDGPDSEPPPVPRGSFKRCLPLKISFKFELHNRGTARTGRPEPWLRNSNSCEAAAAAVIMMMAVSRTSYSTCEFQQRAPDQQPPVHGHDPGRVTFRGRARAACRAAPPVENFPAMGDENQQGQIQVMCDSL